MSKITENEENTKIIKKQLLTQSDKYFLKLNRASSRLEIYEKEEKTKPSDIYPLRENFDTSAYVLYSLKREMRCIFGGNGRKRSPSGFFNIEKVSGKDEEYSSPYYPGYEKVKFFGWLEVFEDYFIHSDIYSQDADADNFRNEKPLSEKDTHTSGCIRVCQDDLDWLIANIPEGTLIEM